MHLSQIPHKILEEYLSAKKADLQRQLDYSWTNNIGLDISNLIRGKIQMLDEILNLRNIFKMMDEMEAKLNKDKEPGK